VDRVSFADEEAFGSAKVGYGKVSESSLGKVAVSDIGNLRRGKPGPFRGLWKHPELPTRLAIVCSGGHAEVIGPMELEIVHSGQLDLRTIGFCLRSP
jgi:hypothetical protein